MARQWLDPVSGSYVHEDGTDEYKIPVGCPQGGSVYVAESQGGGGGGGRIMGSIAGSGGLAGPGGIAGQGGGLAG